MFHKRNYRLLTLALVSLLGVHCGTAVNNPAPAPSAAPIVASFTTTSGTAIGTTGTTDVPIASAFSITFSTAMSTSTLNTTTLTLSCSSTSQTVTVATVGNNGATITPSSSMPEGATCIFTATTGVQSSGGVAMASAATFTFTTVASTPTVSSVTGTAASSGSSATIATTGTTGVSGAVAAPLTVTFSTAMSTSTVTGGMSLECPDGTSQTVTNASTSSTAFTVTPSAALPQQTACVLNLPATITASNGAALAATTYTYTTGCGTSDDFSNSSTLSNCWTAAESSAATISIASNVLNMSTSTDPGFSMVQEYKSFGSDNVTTTVSIPTFSGITSSGDNCGIWLQDGSSAFTGVMAVVSTDGGDIKINNALINGSSDELSASLGTGTSSAALSGTLFLRITQSGSTVTVSYRLGSSGAFTDMTSKSVTYGSTKKIALLLNSDGSGTTNCQYANFTVTGATATGQYSN